MFSDVGVVNINSTGNTEYKSICFLLSCSCINDLANNKNKNGINEAGIKTSFAKNKEVEALGAKFAKRLNNNQKNILRLNRKDNLLSARLELATSISSASKKAITHEIDNNKFAKSIWLYQYSMQ